MRKITAKRVLRYSKPLKLNEATTVSVATETRNIQRVLGRAKMELAAGKALDRTAAMQIKGWIETLEQLDADCGTTLNSWIDDEGQSGMSNKASALDDLSGDLEDAIDVLQHSLQACRFNVRVAKPRKGVNDLIVREARQDLKDIQNEARSLARKLETRCDALDGTYDALDEAIDTDNEEVWQEWEDEVSDVMNELADMSEQLSLVGEQLESV